MGEYVCKHKHKYKHNFNANINTNDGFYRHQLVLLAVMRNVSCTFQISSFNDHCKHKQILEINGFIVKDLLTSPGLLACSR